MADVVVGIHGLANKPDELTISQWWKQSIQEGLKKNREKPNADFEFGMVYWANLLYRHPQHQDVAFNFDSLYNNQPYHPAQGELKEYQDGWRDSIRATVGDISGSVIDRVRGVLGGDPLSSFILQQKLRDLDFYYDPIRQIQDRDGNMRLARAVLMDEFRNILSTLRGQRIMIIAHSMGSIIAYDVLRDLGQDEPDFEVSHFVTIGSPLGFEFVKDRIYTERSYAEIPIRTPTIVTERWMNFADRKDPVAFDTNLSGDFGPNSRGIQVKDDIVFNQYFSPTGEENHHKSYGYLRTPEFSKHIESFLGL